MDVVGNAPAADAIYDECLFALKKASNTAVPEWPGRVVEANMARPACVLRGWGGVVIRGAGPIALNGRCRERGSSLYLLDPWCLEESNTRPDYPTEGVTTTD